MTANVKGLDKGEVLGLPSLVPLDGGLRGLQRQAGYGTWDLGGKNTSFQGASFDARGFQRGTPTAEQISIDICFPLPYS